MSLRANIQELTETHLKMGPAGKPVQAPSLLSELRAAVRSDIAASTQGGSGGRGLLIDAAAMDALRDIDQEARTDYAEMNGEWFAGVLEDLLSTYAKVEPPAEWLAYIERVTLEWIDRITETLGRKAPVRKLDGIDCPACGQSVFGEERTTCLIVHCYDESGDMLKAWEWTVECRACEASWPNDKVANLLLSLSVSRGSQVS